MATKGEGVVDKFIFGDTCENLHGLHVSIADALSLAQRWKRRIHSTHRKMRNHVHKLGSTMPSQNEKCIPDANAVSMTCCFQKQTGNMRFEEKAHPKHDRWVRVGSNQRLKGQYNERGGVVGVVVIAGKRERSADLRFVSVCRIWEK